VRFGTYNFKVEASERAASRRRVIVARSRFLRELMSSLLIIGCSMAPNVGAETEPYFPPRAFVDQNLLSRMRDTSDLLASDFTRHLRAMNEPSLWEASRRDPVIIAYRFLWLPTRERPVAVRIEKTRNGATVSLLQLDGAGGYEPGKVVMNKRVPISQKEWDHLKTLIRRAGIWSMPTRIMDLGFDGESFIVEGVEDGKYHLIFRWTPTPGALREVCRYMLDLTGLDLGQAAWPAPPTNRPDGWVVVLLSGSVLTAILAAFVYRLARRRKPSPCVILTEWP
jgi:hypothetical protein